MEQGGSFCARRCDRGTGHLLGIQLEYSAHRPAAVAQGARVLQTVSSATEPRELEPGSGHPAGQERNGAPEPVARMLAGNTGAQQWAPAEYKRCWFLHACEAQGLVSFRRESWPSLHVRYWPKADMAYCTAHVRL